jgi:hypothetical protein
MLEFFLQFLLSFWNMLLWVAINAIILLVTVELFPGTRFRIDKRRLSIVSLVLSLALMVMVIWYAYQLWTIIQPY